MKDNFIGIDKWEQEHESKLSVEEAVMNSIRNDLGLYASYIDESSIDANIFYESNYLDFDIKIPKNLVSNYDIKDIEHEIKSMIGAYDNYASAPGGVFNHTYIDVTDEDKIWKIRVNRHWGIDV